MSFLNEPGRTCVIAEIGINHNGDMDTAIALIDAAIDADCDAVKFQKRTPRLSLPPEKWNVVRDTPWGQQMTYLEYREKIEFSGKQYAKLCNYTNDRGLLFGASPWDTNALNTLIAVGVDFYKVASAMVINTELLDEIGKLHKPVILSTGMSTQEEITLAVSKLKFSRPLAILACTSAYPAHVGDLNLARMQTLKKLFPKYVIGYSGHESGLWTTLTAVAMGAEVVERHLTLDRTMPGSDQAASVEPQGMKLLVREIRNIPLATGSGELHVLDCELADVKRLRG